MKINIDGWRNWYLGFIDFLTHSRLSIHYVILNWYISLFIIASAGRSCARRVRAFEKKPTWQWQEMRTETRCRHQHALDGDTYSGRGTCQHASCNAHHPALARLYHYIKLQAYFKDFLVIQISYRWIFRRWVFSVICRPVIFSSRYLF